MTTVQSEEEIKENLTQQPLKSKSAQAKPFQMNIHDASSVKPLLERLISKQELGWKETLGKDYRLKWVASNFDD
jgi:hypothetical protein